MEKRIFFVFFCGAWSGGRVSGHNFWFQDVQDWIQSSLTSQTGIKPEFMFITREKTDVSQGAYAEAALRQLENIPDGEAVAVCYSAGAEVARRVAEKRPSLFKAALFLGALEAGGLSWGTFLRCLWHGWLPFLKGFQSGNVDIEGTDCVPVFFTNTKESSVLFRPIQGSLCPEPIRGVLACTPLGWMVGVEATQPLPCPVMALVGEEDFFFAEGATYPGEEGVLEYARGATHALPLQRDLLLPALNRVTKQFAKMLK